MTKKIINITLFFILFSVIIIMGIYAQQDSAFAAEYKTTEEKSEWGTIQKTIYDMLGKTASSMTYMKYADDKDKFVYIEFLEGGYAVFLKDTFEMLEYSPSGKNTLAKESATHYLGPACFCVKEQTMYRNVSDDQIISIGENELKNSSFRLEQMFSQGEKLDASFYSDNKDKKAMVREQTYRTPPFDQNNMIFGDFSTGKFIDDYDYFTSMPKHGVNEHNTCGSVAAQLLLSYNNYYNDRRIIPSSYLFSEIEYNPNTCTDPLAENTLNRSHILGSTDNYYDYIIGKIEPAALSCNHDVTGGSCTGTGSLPVKVYNELDSILSSRGIGYSIEYIDNLILTLPSYEITGEIDETRPVIVALRNFWGDLAHFAVAYGYQEYTYPGGNGTYLGYVTHFGWENYESIDKYEKVWVNSEWCKGCVKLKINHTHNYVDNPLAESEMICSECGHRNVKFLYQTMGDNTIKITGVQTAVSNYYCCPVHVPTKIYGKYVTIVGEDLKNRFIGWHNIVLPKTITKIEKDAFSKFSNIEKIKIISSTNLVNVSDQTLSYSNDYYAEACLYTKLEPDTAYTFSFSYNNMHSSGNTADVFTSIGVGETTLSTEIVRKNFNDISTKQYITFIPSASDLSASSKLWCRFIQTSVAATVSISIENVILEKGVTSIAVDSFRECPYLASFGLKYDTISGCNLSVSQGTMDSNVLFIPSMFSNGPQRITEIAENGFRNNKKIKWIFTQGCLITIGNRAFQFCNNIISVDMYQLSSLTSIGDYAFDVCSMESETNHKHNPHSFIYNFRCMIDKVAFPNNSSLTSIGEGAFIRTGLPTDGHLPDTVTGIGAYAFSDSVRAGFRLPNGLTNIGESAFENCGSLILGNFDVAGSLEIGANAFKNTGLINIDHLPVSLTKIGAGAFNGTMFSQDFVLRTNGALYEIGDEAFGSTNIKRIIITNTVTTMGANVFSGNDKITIYTTRGSKPSGWSSNWNGAHRPVFWGVSLADSCVDHFTKSASNPSYSNATNGISDPFKDGYNFDGWYTNNNYSGTQYTSANIASAPAGTYYAKWTEKSCVAEGTLITLADGSQVAVEDLTGEENLLVWNMLTGEYDAAPILFIDSDPSMIYEVIELTFSDGTVVKVIDEHAFFDMTTGEYVFLRNDAAQYIGHYFNKQGPNGTWISVQLTGVNVHDEVTTAWSPVTYGHLCYYVNGMLSMPGATEGFINIFEVDTSLMQYDEDLMEEDILTYGLYTYEEFNAIIPLPELVFEAFNGQYLKVSIGKGLITFEEIAALLSRYAVFFN